MALTSNETAWATTTVQLIISCAFGALITWITIKAQHAKSMEEIQRAAKNIFARVVLWVGNLFAIGGLVLEYASPEPIDRRDVFLVLWCCCILFLSIILKLMKSLLTLTSLHKKQLELIYSQRNHTGRILDILEDQVLPDKSTTKGVEKTSNQVNTPGRTPTR